MFKKNLKFWTFSEVDGATRLKYFLDDAIISSSRKWYQLAYSKWHHFYLLRFWIQREMLGWFCGWFPTLEGPKISIIFFFMEAFHFLLYVFCLLRVYSNWFRIIYWQFSIQAGQKLRWEKYRKSIISNDNQVFSNFPKIQHWKWKWLWMKIL